MKKQFGKNIDEGEKFLADNKKRDGIQETASGLQYEVITMGTGPKPGAEEVVKVHYTGTLLTAQNLTHQSIAANLQCLVSTRSSRDGRKASNLCR